jgi:hypothetical protein
MINMMLYIFLICCVLIIMLLITGTDNDIDSINDGKKNFASKINIKSSIMNNFLSKG